MVQKGENLQSAEELLHSAQQILQDHLNRLKLKHSAQRETILHVFMATNEHLSTDELHRLVKQQDGTIGYTTVYRTLKLFASCGLASEVAFHDGVMRYERGLHRQSHHHMVCTACGESVEFFAPEIDAVEAAIGKQFRYSTTRHTFLIYGVCEKCGNMGAGA